MICTWFPAVAVKVWSYGPCLWIHTETHGETEIKTLRRWSAQSAYCVRLGTEVLQICISSFPTESLEISDCELTRYYVQGVNMRCLFVSIIFQSHQDFIKERAAQNPSGGPTITQCHMVNKDLTLRYQSLPSLQSALPWDIYINLCSAYCEETREPHYIFFI